MATLLVAGVLALITGLSRSSGFGLVCLTSINRAIDRGAVKREAIEIWRQELRMIGGPRVINAFFSECRPRQRAANEPPDEEATT